MARNWDPINAEEACALNISHASWQDWCSEAGKTDFYVKIQKYCQDVLPQLKEYGCFDCIRFLERLEKEQDVTFGENVHKLSFTNGCGSERYSIVQVSHRITKDVNKLLKLRLDDKYGLDSYLKELRYSITLTVPGFSRLGKQDDRAKVTGILYQLVRECGDPSLADVCLFYSLLNYNKDVPAYALFGYAVSYLLASYRVITRKPRVVGCLPLAFTPVHVAVMQEDYNSLTVLRYRTEDFWTPAGITGALPTELALYGAYKNPSRSSILTLVITCVKAGLLDAKLWPFTWDEEGAERVIRVKTIVQAMLGTGCLEQSAEILKLGDGIFGGSIDMAHADIDLLLIDCVDHCDIMHGLLSMWGKCTELIIADYLSFSSRVLSDDIASRIFTVEDEAVNQNIECMCDLLSFEGCLEYLHRALKPQYLHLTGGIQSGIHSDGLLTFNDDKFVLKCGSFSAPFKSLAHGAPYAVTCPLPSPHTLFHITDMYAYMKICNMLDSCEKWKSFLNQCRGAKQQLSGNALRA